MINIGPYCIPGSFSLRSSERGGPWPKVEKQIWLFSLPPQSGKTLNPGKDQPPSAMVRPDGPGSSLCSPMAYRSPELLTPSEWHGDPFTNGPRGSSKSGSWALTINRVEVESLFSPPQVAIHLVKSACERPVVAGR